jgi:hypothetical protein
LALLAGNLRRRLASEWRTYADSVVWDWTQRKAPGGLAEGFKFLAAKSFRR